MAEQKYYRHGDLLFLKVDSIPKELSLKGRGVKTTPKSHPRGIIVAEGEKTGHHHTLTEVKQYFDFQWGDNNRISFIEIDKPTKVEHEEHGTITLDPGIYQINFQRELNVFQEGSKSNPLAQGINRVVD